MENIAYQRAAADAQIASGPVAIYGMNIISGGTAGVVALRDGTSASDTIIIQEVGTINVGVTKAYGGNGIVFKTGCFCDIDANVSAVTVWFRKLP